MRGAALGRWAGLGLEHDHELECLGPWSTTCAMRERGREAKGCTVVPWGSRVPHVEVGAEGWNLEDLILLYSWHSFATLRWQLPTARFMHHGSCTTAQFAVAVECSAVILSDLLVLSIQSSVEQSNSKANESAAVHAIFGDKAACDHLP